MSTVAVITPIYATPENERLKLFDYTAGSVGKQRNARSNIVHIVVDDGSSVDVESHIRDYKNPQIRYIRREKPISDLKTASNALNLGIDLCIQGSSDIFTKSEASDLNGVTYLHSDDLLTLDSIGDRIKNLDGGFVYTDMAFFNNQGKIIAVRGWKGGSNKEDMLKNNFAFNHHTVMWEMGFLQYLKDFVARKYGQSGIFDPFLSHGEDRDASLSSAEAAMEGGFRVTYIPSVSVLYRVHQQSITGDSAEGMYLQAQLERTFKKHYLDSMPGLELLGRLKADQPWSWFTFLPQGVKRKLRPIKNHIKGVVFGLRYPTLSKTLEEMLA